MNTDRQSTATELIDFSAPVTGSQFANIADAIIVVVAHVLL